MQDENFGNDCPMAGDTKTDTATKEERKSQEKEHERTEEVSNGFDTSLADQFRAKDRKAASLLLKKKNWTMASFQAFLTSLFDIDFTQMAYVPPVSR